MSAKLTMPLRGAMAAKPPNDLLLPLPTVDQGAFVIILFSLDKLYKLYKIIGQ